MKALFRPLLTLAYLLAFALACSSLSGLLGGEEQQPPETTADLEATVETGEAEPTQGVQRLERPPTPTPLEISSSDDPRSILDLTEPDHVDYFDDPTAWFLYEDEYAAYSVADGVLQAVDKLATDNAVYWSYTSYPSGNLYAEISTTLSECYLRDATGFVVRVQANATPSGYALEVSCDGAWRFRRLRPGELPFEMVDWTPDERIHTGAGATNRLGIWGYHGEFVLFINGEQVGAALDSSYTYSLGYFAVYVQAHESYPLIATFDDFAYWNVPYQP